MEKLIDLLNKEMQEKEKAWPKLARFTSYDGINKVFNLNNGCSFCVEFVLSKRYRFIKRLVKNNKIDLSKLWKKSYMWFGDKYTREASLLMILSISNTPIKDLISMLK